MPRRRDILRWAAAALTGAAISRARRVARAAPPPPARRGPRYLLSIYLSGGVDAVLTTDPRTRSEVEPWVDLPYAPDRIVEASGLRLGPSFAPFAAVARDLTIVNGVGLRTANHNTGSEQFLRMKTGTTATMPSILQILGEQRDTQAVGCMDWLFGTAQLDALFRGTPPDDLRRLAGVLRAQARRIGGGGSGPEGRVTAGSLGESAELLDRVADLPPLRTEAWAMDDASQQLAVSLQRILWIFENDLARAVELNVGGLDQPWDTHTFNTDRQRTVSVPLAMIARFFGELSRRRGRRGPLAGETLVVMGSEIGRFPRLNGAEGKDHFPEAPYVLFGAGVGRGAVFGRSGKDMAAVPVSVRTGAAVAGGRSLLLDDLGASLLHLGGVADPSVYGYEGKVLDFLVGA